MWAGDPLTETGVIVAPNGPLTEHEPRPGGVAGDMRFYSIRDPRHSVTDHG